MRVSKRRRDSDSVARWSERKLVIRFVLTFLALLGLFDLYFFTRVVKSPFFRSSLEQCVKISGLFLSALGEKNVAANGVFLGASNGTLEIKQGCDAIQPLGLFVCALLAFPSSARAKLGGVLLGAVAIFGLNVLRVVSLYYVQVHSPRLFKVAHVEVWQPLFILLTLALWYAWARLATRAAGRRDDVPV